MPLPLPVVWLALRLDAIVFHLPPTLQPFWGSVLVELPSFGCKDRSKLWMGLEPLVVLPLKHSQVSQLGWGAQLQRVVLLPVLVALLPANPAMHEALQ